MNTSFSVSVVSRARVIVLACVAVLAATFASGSDKTGLLADGSWLGKIRKDHPRLFFTAEDIPLLRERAQGVNNDEFEELKRYVDALPKKAQKQLREDMVVVNADGSYTRRRADAYGHRLYVRDGSEQSVRAALLYLITGEREYAELAYEYLKLAMDILQETAKNGVWADWMGNFRVNLIATYDWIYNELTPEQRREIMVPLLQYVVDAQPDGAFKFRRSFSRHNEGNYGELSTQYYVGLAAYGDGINDALAEKLVKNGAALFVHMMDFREELSAGSGLLSTITASYSFFPYPFATFLFYHTWKSATGQDISGRWLQMTDFPKWFDYSAIRTDGDRKFLTYGIGDIPHLDNYQSTQGIYLHLAQVIHFYGKNFPEKTQAAYAVLQRLPQPSRDMGAMYPFLPFRLDGFDAEQIDGVDTSGVDFGRYFYNPNFGILLMRSGRGEDDTFASFRFGSKQFIHQHYDELSFVVYRRGFLALDAGSRGPTGNHHMYAAQTVAHNSILIHQKNEPIAPFWRPWGFEPDGKTYDNHGGQNDRTKGVALALQSTKDFIYAAGDATGSYASSKAGEVVRQFVYVKPDIFVIFDRVISVKADQKKEVLFHMQNKPEELAPGLWREDNGGVLFIRTLLPQKASIHLEGGPGREFWASGRNWELDGGENWDRRYQVTGKWRLEVSDGGPQSREGEFLHVLKTALPEAAKNVEATATLDEAKATVHFTDEAGTQWQLAFNRRGTVALHIRQVAPDGKVVFDGSLPNAIEPTPSARGEQGAD